MTTAGAGIKASQKQRTASSQRYATSRSIQRRPGEAQARAQARRGGSSPSPPPHDRVPTLPHGISFSPGPRRALVSPPEACRSQNPSAALLERRCCKSSLPLPGEPIKSSASISQFRTLGRKQRACATRGAHFFFSLFKPHPTAPSKSTGPQAVAVS